MRWDALFDELRAQERDRQALDRAAEARELAQGEWSERSWTAALAGSQVEIRLPDALTFRGRVTAQGASWIALEAAQEDVVIALDAVLDVAVAHPEARRWPEDGDEAPVTARLGWGHVLRALAEDGERVSFLRIDGSALAGVVDVVGRDFVRVLAGETPRLLPYAALRAVRAPR